MLDRIEVDIIQMPMKVVFITNDMVVEALLPKRGAESQFFQAPSHIPFGGRKNLREIR